MQQRGVISGQANFQCVIYHVPRLGTCSYCLNHSSGNIDLSSGKMINCLVSSSGNIDLSSGNIIVILLIRSGIIDFRCCCWMM